jgi:hypothetical protein
MGHELTYSEKGPALSNSQTRKAAGTWEDQEIPGPPPRDPGPDFRFRAESGNGGFPDPDSRPNPDIPGFLEKKGISRFPIPG